MRITNLFSLAFLGLTLGLAACGSQEAKAAGNEAEEAVGESSSAPAPASGNVIEVKMVTDGAGNYFEPANVTVGRGDVLRFVLVSGVHNVSFPADKNAGAASLPGTSPYLQLPGQTYDVTVDLPAGEYAFQCDPHAALGMVGTLTVE